MGGDLQVESEKGKGSRFFFTVEFETTDLSLLHDANQKIFIDTEVLRGKTILVVEDNKFNQFIVKSILGKWNIVTEIASNGMDAIELVSQKNFDLILMDMQMPVMDGCTATRVIRKELNISIPVIALTAFATKGAIAQTVEAGMNGYLTKPFEEETLYSQLLFSFGISPRYLSDPELNLQSGPQDADLVTLHYDLGKLSKLLGGNKEGIIDMIDQFILITPEYSEELFTAFDENNMDELAKAAHKIKSSLEMLASGALRSNIKLIHQYSGNNENIEKLPGLVKSLRESIPVLLSQLREKAEELRRKS